MPTDFLNRIHQGDCVAGMNSLPAETIDLAFADPPFNIGYKYDVYDDRREREHYLDWSREWIGAVHRVLKADGTFWLAIGDEYAAELKIASQEIGFTCRSWVVWYYTFGVNCKNKFTRSHAHLFYFVKNAERFTFLADEPANRIPSARQLVYNDARANPRGRLPDDTWILRPQDLDDCFTASEDTWYFPRVAGTFKERAGFHGCQMPEQLLGRIIRCCSNEGDVVLDPFSGSATTLVTAKKLGRRYVGFELSPDYAERGSARVEAAEVGAPLVGASDPTRSAPSTAAGRRLEDRGKLRPQPEAAASQRFAIAAIAAGETARKEFAAEAILNSSVHVSREDLVAAARMEAAIAPPPFVESLDTLAEAPNGEEKPFVPLEVTAVEEPAEPIAAREEWAANQASESVAAKAEVPLSAFVPVEPAVAASHEGAPVEAPASDRPMAETAAEPLPLVEAFRQACGGFSLDRVVADPKLQDALAKACRKLHVPGTLVDWNEGLFRLRKTGKLSKVPTTERTERSWEEIEPYVFAAEIAAASVLRTHALEGFDEVLCDPKLAAEFDKLSTKYDGTKRTFEHRWAALKLRKEAKQLRVRAEEFRRIELSFSVPVVVGRGRWAASLPREGGLYLVLNGEGERLYVGAASELRSRIERQLAAARLRLYDPLRDVRVAVASLDASITDLLAHQMRVVAKSPTRFNWRLPAEPDTAKPESDTKRRNPRLRAVVRRKSAAV